MRSQTFAELGNSVVKIPPSGAASHTRGYNVTSTDVIPYVLIIKPDDTEATHVDTTVNITFTTQNNETREYQHDSGDTIESTVRSFLGIPCYVFEPTGRSSQNQTGDGILAGDVVVDVTLTVK